METQRGSDLMRTLVCLCLVLIFSGCSSEERDKTAQDAKPKKELLVFCGITMIDPVRELMERFELESGVKMTMSYGGSADLMQSIKLNGIGDIYFPGGENFIIEADKEGIVRERKQVGINQMGLIVKKGNPHGLTGDLDELFRPDIQVGVGHPDLGSVGKEAQRVLQAKGIYDQVVAAAAMMQPDSKGLTGALREGKVDVVLNWQAVVFIQDNSQYMEVLPIKGGLAIPHKLTMAVISHSREPELANRFLELCASERGRAVFQRYGF
jgi:molybdate transport system substrate-binding protein